MKFLFWFLIILVPLILLFLIIFSIRYQIAKRKTKALPYPQKLSLLSDLLTPFGFCYVPDSDFISTTRDAWQRDAGYTSLYDKSAIHLHMVFDAQPIFFDYCGRTWRIEIWKGQYGINTGAEVGIYYADKIIPPDEYATTLFHAVSDCDSLPISFTLFKNKNEIASICNRTWWLTAFRPGMFSNPKELCSKITITFPNCSMEQRFFKALLKTELPRESYHACGTEVHINFSHTDYDIYEGHCPLFHKIQTWFMQLRNRKNSRLFMWITHPFSNTMDKIIFLYFLLPSILRKLLRHLKGYHKV